MKKLALLGALALSVFSLVSQADEKPLKIGIEAAYPPFAFKQPMAASPVSTTTSATPCANR